MISHEQIAHDLAIVYLCNRYGVQVSGRIANGIGTVETNQFPGMTEVRYATVKTGEKGLFGIDKTQKVEAGLAVDNVFRRMISDYEQARAHFLEMLNDQA